MKIIMLLILTAFTPLLAQTELPFCAVELAVTLPDGSPAHVGIAKVMDEQGRQVQSAPIIGGRGQICDLGFGAHAIRIEGDGSLPVTLSGVLLTFGNTQHLRVVMNPVADAGSQGGGGNACRAYFRIRTVDDEPIANAEVLYGGRKLHSDDFGRILVLLPLKQFTSLKFEHAGFRPAELLLGCTSWDELTERLVILGRE